MILVKQQYYVLYLRTIYLWKIIYFFEGFNHEEKENCNKIIEPWKSSWSILSYGIPRIEEKKETVKYRGKENSYLITMVLWN